MAMEVFKNPWFIAIASGIIVFLIIYLIRRFLIPKLKNGHRVADIHDKNHATPSLLSSKGAPSNITPKDIRDYLNSLPPLQRDSAAENYKGIRVSWKVSLHGATTLSDGKLQLYMHPSKKLPFPSVKCTVNPEQYPVLRVIKKTQTFTVEGEIQQVKLTEINLKNCRLFF
jgi:hypothetical protein